jgi:hypothetical protein
MTIGKIYFKGWEECKTVKEVLVNGFTYEGDTILLFKRTYSDETFQTPQCHEARRSFEDLYLICATCIPGLSIEQFAKEFEKFFDETAEFSTLYCYDIMKPVHYMTKISWLQNSDDYVYCLKVMLSDSEEDDEPDTFEIVEKQVNQILNYYQKV